MEFDDVTYTHIVLLPKRNAATGFLNWLKKAAHIVNDKFWLVLLTTVVSLVVAFVWNEATPPVYAANAIVRFDNRDESTALASFLGLSLYSHDVHLKQFQETLRSSQFADFLRLTPAMSDILTTESTPVGLQAKSFEERLQNGLECHEQAGDNTLRITMTDTNPRLAATLVNTLADAYNNFVASAFHNTDATLKGIKNLSKYKLDSWTTLQNINVQSNTPDEDLILSKLKAQSTLQTLGPDADETKVALADVAAQQTRLLSRDDLNHFLASAKLPEFPFVSGQLTVIENSVLPTTPIGAAKSQRLLVALLCGLGFGSIFATFIGFQDEKIYTALDIEADFNIPVLGVIPPIKAAA